MNRQCSNCEHFHQTDKRGNEGQCRKSPPTGFMFASMGANPLTQKPQLDLQFPTAWPAVPGDGWCGEFSPDALKRS